MMTRKDYEAIASVIRDVLQDITDEPCMQSETVDTTVWPNAGLMVASYVAAIGNGLANYMEYDNPNFIRSKFTEASSRVEVKATSKPPAANIYIHTLHGGDTNGN